MESITKPVIGIVFCGFSDDRLFVPFSYIQAIEKSDGIPVIIPYLSDADSLSSYLSICDGFLFCGGDDITPELFGEELQTDHGTTDRKTDQFHLTLMQKVLDFHLPVLGICRGMQTMNVASGGTLYIDLPTEFKGVDNLTKRPLNHWQTLEATESAHYVDVVRGTKLHDIIGADSAAANSFHHQGVKVVGPDFKPAAYATDGLVEAIECEDMSFMIGVQWHPEFFLGDKHMGNLFSSLVTAAAQARESGRLDAADGYQIDDLGSDEALEGKGRVLLHSMKKRYAV